MDIEGIKRHEYNFRMFCCFLKEKKLYQTFKKLIFIDCNRTPHDLFVTMNKSSISRIICNIDKEHCEIDKKWSAIFTYVPFCRFRWSIEKGITSYENMMNLTKEWCRFLIENNYDKQQT